MLVESEIKNADPSVTRRCRNPVKTYLTQVSKIRAKTVAAFLRLSRKNLHIQVENVPWGTNAYYLRDNDRVIFVVRWTTRTYKSCLELETKHAGSSTRVFVDDADFKAVAETLKNDILKYKTRETNYGWRV